MHIRRRSLIRFVFSLFAGFAGMVLGTYIYGLTGIHGLGYLFLPIMFIYLAVPAYLSVPYIERFGRYLINYFQSTPVAKLFTTLAGMIIGLVIAALAAVTLRDLPYGGIVSGFGALVLALAGAKLGSSRAPEVMQTFHIAGVENENFHPRGIVVDTSAIIDGRLLPLAKIGFLGDRLIVAHAVVSELQRLVESNDKLKQARGKRGLDLLIELQNYSGIQTMIMSGQTAIGEVDEYLVQLCRELNCPLLTVDYNLGLIAKAEKVKVFSLHELALYLRPNLVPGETLELAIVREGRAPNQGVGYLDDGTMVVVEDGRNEIGNVVSIKVNSITQNATGRMVFAHVSRTDNKKPPTPEE